MIPESSRRSENSYYDINAENEANLSMCKELIEGGWEAERGAKAAVYHTGASLQDPKTQMGNI